MSLNWLAVFGDALWIVCLALIAGASSNASKRILPGVKIPVWGIAEKPLFRLPRIVGLWAFPVIATAIGLALSAMARRPVATPMQPLLLMGVRTFLAPMLVLSHLGQIKAAIELLQAEGKLKP